MSSQSITVSAEQLERAEKFLSEIPGGAKKALMRAINRSTQTASGSVVKQLRSVYEVQAKAVRETIHISKATMERLSASVISKGPGLPLYAFKVQPSTANARRRTPLRATIKKGSSHTFNNAFIARMPSGHIGAFERTGLYSTPRRGRYAGSGQRRERIRELRSPSVPQMIGNEQVIERIAEEARATMNQRLDHEIERLLSGGAR